MSCYNFFHFWVLETIDGESGDCGFAESNWKTNVDYVKPCLNQILCLQLNLCASLLHLVGLIVAVLALIEVYTKCNQKNPYEL